MVTIRKASTADAAHILHIYDYYIRKTAITFEYDAPSLAEFQTRMAKTMRAGYPYLVAEEKGKLLGYAYAGPFVGRAAYQWSCETSIYLDRKAVKRGIGRKLYTELERELFESGTRNLYACIAYPAEEEDAYLTTDSADFHAHLGFTRVGTFHKCGYKFGRWYDMIWMEKLIAPHDEI